MSVWVGEEVRQFLTAFYASNKPVQLRDPVRLEASLDTLIAPFERVGLRTDVSKTKTMVCVLGRIRTSQSQATYAELMEGHAEVGKWKRLHVGCDVCGKDLAYSSLQLHLETQLGIYRLFVLSQDLVDEDRPPVTYQATSFIATSKFACPVPGCVGEVGTKYAIRRRFHLLVPAGYS